MLNKQGKIDWTNYTWNPITGCLFNCPYCYARRMAHRFKRSFKPEFHGDRLWGPASLKKPSKIFACSVSDFWGKGVKQAWRDEVYRVIKFCYWHTFQILTKQPQNITDAEKIPENVWVGVTVNTSKDWERASWLDTLKIDNVKFISLEPLLSKIPYMVYQPMGWVIVGADSTKGAKKPPREWLDDIVAGCASQKIPLWIKDNYNYPERIKEFPNR